MKKGKCLGKCPNCGPSGIWNSKTNETDEADYWDCEKCGKDIKDKEFVCFDATGGAGDPAHFHIKCFDTKQFIVKANAKGNYDGEEDNEDGGE